MSLSSNSFNKESVPHLSEEDKKRTADYDFIDKEEITEDQFYGLDVLEQPPEQKDNEMDYLPYADKIELMKEDSNNTNEKMEWKDKLLSNPNVDVTFVIDEAVNDAWENFKDEVKFLCSLLDCLIT